MSGNFFVLVRRQIPIIPPGSHAKRFAPACSKHLLLLCWQLLYEDVSLFHQNGCYCWPKYEWYDHMPGRYRPGGL